MSSTSDDVGPIRDDAFGYAVTCLGLGVLSTCVEYGAAAFVGEWIFGVFAAAQAAAWMYLSRARIERVQLKLLYLVPIPSLFAKYYFIAMLPLGESPPTPAWLGPTLLGLIAVWLAWTLLTIALAFVTRRPAP